MRNIDASQWLRNPSLEVIQTPGLGPRLGFTLSSQQVSVSARRMVRGR